MVWFNPFTPPPAQPPTAPPRPDVRVLAVRPLKDDERKRNNQERDQRRRRVFDLLMEEVESLPGIEEPHQTRLRDNLRDYVRRELSKPPEQRRSPPPAEADPDLHAEHVAEALAPAPQEHPPGEPAVEPTPSEAEQTLASAMAAEAQAVIAEAEEARRLATQFRACLSLRTDVARKISTYIHALLTTTHEQHLLEIDV